MDASIQTIPVTNLLIAFVPVALVLIIMLTWAQKTGQALYAIARMVLQLVVIGYLLVFIFERKHSLIVVKVLTIMLVAAG